MARRTDETRFVLLGVDKTRAAFTTAGRGLATLKRSVSGLHASIIGLAGITGAGFLVRGLISTNAEIQTLKSSLATVTGSTENAARAFEKIEKFATTTPYDLQQVAQAFVKLKALGLDPSEAALRSYGNTASAMGKSLDQMIEAVADAATGEFERLKEFGIRASSAGDQVTFTFQGVETTVKKSADAISAYLQQIGNVNFGGAMERQMGNLTPAFSNFSAAIDMFMVKVGEAGFNESVAGLVNSMTDLVNSLDAQAIADFTSDALDSFAGFLEGIDFITESIGRTMKILDDLFNPTGPGIPGGSASYRLGDFNRGIRREGSERFLDLADRQSGRAGPEREQVDTTNNLLREISQRIRERQAAVAG